MVKSQDIVCERFAQQHRCWGKTGTEARECSTATHRLRNDTVSCCSSSRSASSCACHMRACCFSSSCDCSRRCSSCISARRCCACTSASERLRSVAEAGGERVGSVGASEAGVCGSWGSATGWGPVDGGVGRAGTAAVGAADADSADCMYFTSSALDLVSTAPPLSTGPLSTTPLQHYTSALHFSPNPSALHLFSSTPQHYTQHYTSALHFSTTPQYYTQHYTQHYTSALHFSPNPSALHLFSTAPQGRAAGTCMQRRFSQRKDLITNRRCTLHQRLIPTQMQPLLPIISLNLARAR